MELECHILGFTPIGSPAKSAQDYQLHWCGGIRANSGHRWCEPKGKTCPWKPAWKGKVPTSSYTIPKSYIYSTGNTKFLGALIEVGPSCLPCTSLEESYVGARVRFDTTCHSLGFTPRGPPPKSAQGPLITPMWIHAKPFVEPAYKGSHGLIYHSQILDLFRVSNQRDPAGLDF